MDEQTRSLLTSHGLAEYCDLFQRNQVTYSRFMVLTRNDLVGMGVTNEPDLVKLMNLVSGDVSAPAAPLEQPSETGFRSLGPAELAGVIQQEFRKEGRNVTNLEAIFLENHVDGKLFEGITRDDLEKMGISVVGDRVRIIQLRDTMVSRERGERGGGGRAGGVSGGGGGGGVSAGGGGGADRAPPVVGGLDIAHIIHFHFPFGKWFFTHEFSYLINNICLILVIIMLVLIVVGHVIIALYVVAYILVFIVGIVRVVLLIVSAISFIVAMHRDPAYGSAIHAFTAFSISPIGYNVCMMYVMALSLVVALLKFVIIGYYLVIPLFIINVLVCLIAFYCSLFRNDSMYPASKR